MLRGGLTANRVLSARPLPPTSNFNANQDFVGNYIRFEKRTNGGPNSINKT